MEEPEKEEAIGREISSAAFPTDARPVFMKMGFLVFALACIIGYLLWEGQIEEEPSPIEGDLMKVFEDGSLDFRGDYQVDSTGGQ